MTMAIARFSRFTLRTTDLDRSREFYAAVLGAAFWGPDVVAVPLPTAAAARGAPPHWLGHVGVHDVADTVARIVARGGTQLGPPQRVDDRGYTVVRDPFGAGLALEAEPAAADRGVVAWHLCTVPDDAAALAMYVEELGWTPITRDASPTSQRRFAWEATGVAVGGFLGNADTPGVHPQWLHFFAVTDLDAALAVVRAQGGLALPPVRTDDGRRFAPCDDPQGAAFGLCEAPR